MAKLTLCCLAAAMMLGLVYAQDFDSGREQGGIADPGSGGTCEPCDLSKCTRYENCEAGLVKDHCSCCDICAKKQGEECDHPAVPFNGRLGECGINLECRLREDLKDGDPPQAICFCLIEGALCGSDNVTYDSLCRLMGAVFRTNNKITVQNKGPCKTAPAIQSPPDHVQNVTGSNIALSCEAVGFPIPSIEWTWTRVDGKTEFLPNDDLRVSTLMRGGPEKWEVTGWLQITDLQKEHEGDYTCIAQNHYGSAKAMARVNVSKIKGYMKPDFLP